MAFEDTIRLTRSELYDMVWSESLVKLSTKLGISDNGIRKVCKRYNIPLPVQGYWARKRRPSTRPPLPTMKSDIVEIQKIASRHTPEILDALNDKITELDRTKFDEKHVIVEPTLREPHPLVRKAEEVLSNARTDDRGLLVPYPKQCLDIRVSKGSLDRALRIMDALIKALAERKIKVRNENEGQTTYVKIDDEIIGFYLRESIERKERKLSSAERKKLEEDPWSYIDNRYRHTPRGVLSLSIKTDSYYSDGYRVAWSDGKKQTLESCLNEFIRGLFARATIIKAKRIESERREKEVAERKRIRYERLLLQEKEQKEVESLMSEASSWNKSRELRMYVAAVKEAAEKQHGNLDPDSKIAKWIEWATYHADRLDPLVESPPSILDEDLRGWY